MSHRPSEAVTGSGASGDLVTPSDIYPHGGGQPRFTIIDVRAPVEAVRGALPNALNLPILEDDERRRVGIEYKEAGQEAAIALGHRLTAASMAQRVAGWRQTAETGPAAVCCWRGGLRSSLAQQFLGEPVVPRVAGGYKALRSHLLSGMALSLQRKRHIVLTGMTGSGKTDLLESLSTVDGLLALDLEGLARHRGSAFGGLEEQPAQQTFENELAARVMLDPAETVLVEDESRRIGALSVPDELYGMMAEAPLLVLEASWPERVLRIHQQYILMPAQLWGPERALAELLSATGRLKRRLGGPLVERLSQVLRAAFESGEWQEAEALQGFIGPLLREYYDPLYRRAATKLQRPVLHAGTREELIGWLAHRLSD